MTIQEAKEIIDNHNLYDSKYYTNDCDLALDTLLEAIKKAEKYQWHDLIEHPEDVPDSKRFVEVRTEDSFPYYFGWYDTESETGMWYDAIGFSMNPYKWREIEEEVGE